MRSPSEEVKLLQQVLAWNDLGFHLLTAYRVAEYDGSVVWQPTKLIGNHWAKGVAADRRSQLQSSTGVSIELGALLCPKCQRCAAANRRFGFTQLERRSTNFAPGL